MALIAGREGRLYVSDDGGSTFTLLGCAVDISPGFNQEELDATCHEDGQFRAYIPGRKDATLDTTLHWDEADAGQQIVSDAFFAGTSIQVRFRMQEGAGFDQWTAGAFITNYSPTSPNDDMADVEISFRWTGDFSPSVQV